MRGSRLPPRFRRAELFGEGGFPVGSGRFRLDSDLPPHSHDFVEIAILVAGHVVHVRDDDRRPLRPGDVVCLRPGQWHAYTDCRAADIVNLYLGPELLRRELLWTLDHPDLARFLLSGGQTAHPLGSGTVDRLLDWAERLGPLTTRPATPDAAVALGLMCCALGVLATGTYDDRRSHAISGAARTALLIMSENPAAVWSMPVLADRVGVSVPHLHRRFTAQVGVSPMAWLARARVELAASLLIQSERPITDIGRRVGWTDPNYFSRRFRAITGTSPSEYRRRFRT